LQVVADRAAGQRTLRRRCGTPLPQAAGPGSRTGPDLQSLVADPGFEPGKAFADDFTDPGRYCLSWANVSVVRHFGTHLT